jgi:hypothetical protein
MYIDPGAGSLLLQVLAAGIISVVATVGRVRTAVKSFFRGVFSRGNRT